MANLLRRDRRRQGKDTSLLAPSKRSPRKSMPQPPEPNAQEKPQENNLLPNPKAWLKKLLRIGK